MIYTAFIGGYFYAVWLERRWVFLQLFDTNSLQPCTFTHGSGVNASALVTAGLRPQRVPGQTPPLIHKLMTESQLSLEGRWRWSGPGDEGGSGRLKMEGGKRSSQRRTTGESQQNQPATNQICLQVCTSMNNDWLREQDFHNTHTHTYRNTHNLLFFFSFLKHVDNLLFHAVMYWAERKVRCAAVKTMQAHRADALSVCMKGRIFLFLFGW